MLCLKYLALVCLYTAVAAALSSARRGGVGRGSSGGVGRGGQHRSGGRPAQSPLTPQPSPPPLPSASPALLPSSPRGAAAGDGGGTSTVPRGAATLGRTVPSAARVWAWREDAREAVSHAFESYMEHAYPADELRPLTCDGRRWDARERGTLDDSLGGFSLTLVDALDTLAMTGDLPAFRCAVSRVVADVRLDRDVPVSVFEASIRVLGGLISAHMLAAAPELRLFDAALHCANSTVGVDGATVGGDEDARASRCAAAMCGHGCSASACLAAYSGELLSMAVELGTRLLPAFDTPSGIPYHRINLATGAVDAASRETCTAAGGTYVLEFGALSRLSGLPVFEAAARRAVAALGARRSPATGLVGSGIDAVAGVWRVAHTGVGAGVDSFLEYLLKAAVALDDDELLAEWRAASGAVAAHTTFSDVHLEVGLHEGRRAPRGAIVSALQAFWPGLEVLDGRISDARAHLRPLLSLWAKYSALPEAYDVVGGAPVHFSRDAPLRPELAESVYHLYTATRDPALLAAAGAMLDALNASSRVACGFASVADVTTGRLDDRMDSYVLAETLKYAFLTFDAALQHWGDGPPVPRVATLRSGGSALRHVEAAGCACPRVAGDSGGGGPSRRATALGMDEASAAYESPLVAAEDDNVGGGAAASELKVGAAVSAVGGSGSGEQRIRSSAAPSEQREHQLILVDGSSAAAGAHHAAVGYRVEATDPAGAGQAADGPDSPWCYYACAAARLFPRAHPLAFVRRDAAAEAAAAATHGGRCEPGAAHDAACALPPPLATNASDDSGALLVAAARRAAHGRLASLPLREDTTIFTTEGHVLLITPALQRRAARSAGAVGDAAAQLAAAAHASPPAHYLFKHGAVGLGGAGAPAAGRGALAAEVAAAAAAAAAASPTAVHGAAQSPQQAAAGASSTCLAADAHDALRWATHLDDPAGSEDLHPRGLPDFDDVVAPSIRASLAENAARGAAAAPPSATPAEGAPLLRALSDVLQRAAAGFTSPTSPLRAPGAPVLATPRPQPSLHDAHRLLVRAALRGDGAGSGAPTARRHGAVIDPRIAAQLPHLLPPSPQMSKLLLLVNTSDLLHRFFGSAPSEASEADGGYTADGSGGGDDDDGACAVPSFDDGSRVGDDGGGDDDDAACGGQAASATSAVCPADGGDAVAAANTPRWRALSPAVFIASSWTGALQPFPGAALAEALNVVPGAAASIRSVLVHCSPLTGSCAISTQMTEQAPPLVLHIHAERGAPLSRALTLFAPDGDAGGAAAAPPPAAPPSAEPVAVDDTALRLSGTFLAEAARRHAAARHAVRSVDRGGDEGATSSDLYLPAMAASFGPVLTAAGVEGLRVRLANPLNACAPGGTPLRARADGGVLVVAARGGCTFADKARNLHASGAVAGVVVDLEAIAGALNATAPAASRLDAAFVMADDGTGRDVSMPLAMLSARDGALLLTALRVVRRLGIQEAGRRSPVALADVAATDAAARHGLQTGRRVQACLFSSAAGLGSDHIGGDDAPSMLPAASRLVLDAMSEVLAASTDGRRASASVV